jgi:aryl-alcohol dehydrogenase-like predicted oxidoreductase
LAVGVTSGVDGVIERIPFGRTGHYSSRAIFGAAALGAMRQERADRVLETLLEHGINHIDTAARYGDSELRIAPWMRQRRDDFFLATKTGERSAEGARASLENSLERLGVDRIDLFQLHNLVDEAEWEVALGPGGALEAAIQARDEGRVRFLGVTGHGTRVAAMHRRSLERFDFDSVLLPCSHTLMQSAEYRTDFEVLLSMCRERGVAVQTIKAVARRRWTDGDETPHYSWYEPLRDADAIRRAVHYVLQTPDLFLNTSSDATILPAILEAAGHPDRAPSDASMSEEAARLGIEPIFVRGVSDAI